MVRSLSSRASSDDGFTLIEVMVVVLIIGILLSIGVPTFLGARNSASDRTTQADLATTYRVATFIMLDTNDVGAADSEALSAEEPGFTFVKQGIPSTEPGLISIRSRSDLVDANGWSAASVSASGTCFFIRVSEGAAAERGIITDDRCTGVAALTATAGGW